MDQGAHHHQAQPGGPTPPVSLSLNILRSRFQLVLSFPDIGHQHPGDHVQESLQPGDNLSNHRHRSLRPVLIPKLPLPRLLLLLLLLS